MRSASLTPIKLGRKLFSLLLTPLIKSSSYGRPVKADSRVGQQSHYIKTDRRRKSKHNKKKGL